MKTQVIQLDLHDDVTSVRDKMSWAKTPRILLVYPRRSHNLGRLLDLRLLQRHASILGAQLAIVAPSADIRQSARELGIPIYKTITIAQRRTWKAQSTAEPPVRRYPPSDLRLMQREVVPAEGRWRNLIGIRLLFFTLAVLAVLALLVLFFPSATVVLTPETRMQSLTISASASPKAAAVELNGSLPSQLAFTVIEQSKTAQVTGSVITPNTPAAGLARFRNLSIGTMKIPSGTVIRTTGSTPVRFTTTADAVMPAGVAGTVDVPVQALEPGASGNLPADSLIAIEGDLGTSLAVTNPSPTTGGSDHRAPIQTAGDRTHLHGALVSAILDQCKTSLPQSLGQGDIFFPDTLAVGKVLSETYFPADGQTGATLSLTMSLKCEGQYARAADVNSLANLAMNTHLPAGFEAASNAVTSAASSAPVTDSDGNTSWKITARRLLRAHIDPIETMQMIQGRSLSVAGHHLSTSLKLVATPVIHVTPAWWPWLPVFPFRIAIFIAD
jgi:hypothetical protein